jgi:HEAT repeat protein
MLKKIFSIGVTVLVLASEGRLFAQGFGPDSILISYKRNFVRASLSTKSGILRDAAGDEKAQEFISPFYDFALKFVLDNAELLRNDPDMIALAGIAVQGVGEIGNKSAADTLWKVFQAFEDSFSRGKVLEALASLGKGNSKIIGYLNQFLADQNNLFRSGISPDLPSLIASIRTLGILGDVSSFPVLFAAMVCNYSQEITAETVKAQESIQGNLKQFLSDVIRKNPPQEKLIAFNLAARSSRFTDADRGLLAETALETALNLIPGESPGLSFPQPPTEAIAASLRYAAVEVITQLEWVRATPLVIRHFYLVQTDYENGVAPKDRLIEAINCLGAMGNSDAAQVLSLQLGFFNSQTERTGEFDEKILLAVIHALGKIGDKVAFDYLLYMSYLSYPETIQAAAKEALNRLKW